jgi:hypothetical protein
MLTVPPFTPSGPGFVNGTILIDAAWLNYISQNFPRALDAVGGGYYQGSTDALRLSGDLRKITISSTMGPGVKVDTNRLRPEAPVAGA